MVMGDKGGSMGDMQMPLPDNTLPMMMGVGPYGNIEMGGMFSIVKVREGLARNDYKDPGWYRQPPGTQAYEWTGEMPAAPKAPPQRDAVPSAPDQPVLNIKRGGVHEH
jgi:hypothetical protein